MLRSYKLISLETSMQIVIHTVQFCDQCKLKHISFGPQSLNLFTALL